MHDSQSQNLKGIIRRVARSVRLGSFVPLDLAVLLYGGTDKGRHKFIQFYRDHVGHRRWRRNRVLEIGVGGYESRAPGGSLRVWRDYFPLSRIVGFDIADKDIDLGPRVSFVRGDQNSCEDLGRAINALGGPPDIIIDDGSHMAKHAEASFRFLFPLMPSGSVYVIEDLHTSYWPDFGGDLPAPSSTAVGFTKLLVDAVQANDVTFTFPIWSHAQKPTFDILQVAAVNVYPGIVFVRKA